MRGAAYFPLAGCFIGVFVSSFYDFGNVVLSLPPTVAACLSVGASLWVTGCFHEDGLGDSADGIGGGWSRSEILRIMTDTRLGTYGCAVLILHTLAKIELLTALGSGVGGGSSVSVWGVGCCEGAGPALVVVNAVARLTAPIMIRTRDYVDESGPKQKYYSFMVRAKDLCSWYRVCFALGCAWFISFVMYGVTVAVLLVSG